MILAFILAGAYVVVLLAAVAWQAIAWLARIAVTRVARSPAQTDELAIAPHVVVTLVHGTLEAWRSALITRWRLLVPLCVVLVGFAIFSVAKAERGSLLEVSGIAAGALIAIPLAIMVRGGLVAAVLGALLIAVLAAPSFLVIGALGIATGPELLIAALLFRVTAETAAPGGAWTVWQVPREPWNADPGAFLMHSATYDDEESLVIVSQWLAEREQPA
jgi:hypothetical protein